MVLDLETTGGSPADDAITEVGAAKFRGGECLGTFQTLVNPGVPDPAVDHRTSPASPRRWCCPRRRIEEVLPSFLEFVGDAVLVGHNVRFDVGFLQAALRAAGPARLTNRAVDTCALARRLVSDEVPNCKLSTLAAHFRTTTSPPTARSTTPSPPPRCCTACSSAPAASASPRSTTSSTCHRSRDTRSSPSCDSPRDSPASRACTCSATAAAAPLYVGKAVDLRRRVRSYFTGDGRRKVGQLLRETQAIDHVVCADELEASVLEVRLIHSLAPRFNRQAKLWRRYAYLKLTLDERFPRLSIVRAVRAGDGCLYLGPLSSSGAAQSVADAIESVVPIRRCRGPVRRAPRAAECTPAQLGVATCPCAGTITEEAYGELVAEVVAGLTVDPDRLLSPLRARMHALAAAERFEEAAAVRDRAETLARAIGRQRRLDALAAAGRMVVEVAGGGGVVIEGGRLLDAWSAGEPDASARICGSYEPADPRGSVLARDAADEVACVAAWLDREAPRLRLVSCDGDLTSTVPRLPRFAPIEKRSPTARGR